MRERFRHWFVQRHDDFCTLAMTMGRKGGEQDRTGGRQVPKPGKVTRDLTLTLNIKP